MSRPWPRREFLAPLRPRRGGGWLLSAALMLAAPKCTLCVLGYLGLGAAAAGSGGLEWCGSPAGTPSLLPTLGVWLCATLLGALAVRRCLAAIAVRRLVRASEGRRMDGAGCPESIKPRAR